MTSDVAKFMFIVLYGINNLGKTTQARLLVERLRREGFAAEYLKYPIYGLTPTGPALNDILRSGNPQRMSEVALQALYAQNRRDYQPVLERKLASGMVVVAEDYTGTGIAWGLAKGAPRETLERMNADLRREDVGIWLDGERFLTGREDRHLHESSPELISRCRQTHRTLAERYGWLPVNANQSVPHVADDIWRLVAERIARPRRAVAASDEQRVRVL